jgi:hypothetical protein
LKNRHSLILILASILLLVSIFGLALIFTGYTPAPRSPVNTTGTGIPNPAAEYCTSMHNRYEIRTATDGSQFGVCILPDGVECDEWAYYRGTCPAVAGPGEAAPDPAADFCLSGNYMYQTRKDVDGNEVAVCVFPDGSQCDAMQYYEGSCNETTAKAP